MTAIDPRNDWCADHDNLVSFATALAQGDWLSTPNDVIEFFAKPWKFTNEFELWDGCGRPQADDASWSWFVAKLDKLS